MDPRQSPEAIRCADGRRVDRIRDIRRTTRDTLRRPCITWEETTIGPQARFSPSRHRRGGHAHGPALSSA